MSNTASTIIGAINSEVIDLSHAPATTELINAVSHGIDIAAAATANTVSQLKTDEWGRVTITVPITNLEVPYGLVLSSNVVINADGTTDTYLYADWNPPVSQSTAFNNYNVKVRNVTAATTPVEHVTYSRHYQEIVTSDTMYGVSVRAVDIFLTPTEWCPEVLITTARDTIPPEQPFNVILTSFTGAVRLNWDHGGESDLSHFDVYANSTNNLNTATKIGSGVKDFLGTWAQFTWDPGDYNVWYFWVYAVDNSQNYSAVSDVVSGAKIKITGTNIEDLSIWTQALANNAITREKILAGAVSDVELANSAVTAAKIAVDAVDASKIANNAITREKILAGAVNTLQIANNAITTALIAQGNITDTLIANNAITSPKIAANAVTANNILAGTITASQIASNAITASNIAASTITGDKISSNTITASNIATGTITSTEIAANTIRAGNIAASTISGDKIAANTISATNIASATITGDKISSNTITADNILTGTITALKIAAGTITGDKISSNTIYGSNIVGTTITGDKIASLAITSDKIYVSSLAAINANMGAITAGTLTSSNYNGTQGSYFNLNNGILKIGGSTNPKFNFDGTNLTLNVDTFKIAGATTSLFEVSAGIVRVNGNFVVNGTVNTAQMVNNSISSMNVASLAATDYSVDQTLYVSPVIASPGLITLSFTAPLDAGPSISIGVQIFFNGVSIYSETVHSGQIWAMSLGAMFNAGSNSIRFYMFNQNASTFGGGRIPRNIFATTTVLMK